LSRIDGYIVLHGCIGVTVVILLWAGVLALGTYLIYRGLTDEFRIYP